MRKYLTLIFFVGTFLFYGCSDWLNVLPKNEQITENFWQSKEDVEAILASGYYYMRTCTPYLIDWGELRASSIIAYNSTEKEKLQNFQLIASSSLCVWESFYQTINMANSVIAYAPQVLNIDETYSESAMESHRSEAYFMRALMYFYLVRNFKEVPMPLEPYIDDSAPYSLAKSSEESIILQIKSDIETALASNAAKEFHDFDWEATKGRATKWSLYALMCDVSLWSEDYDNCIKYADYLLNATSAYRPAFMSMPEQWFSIFNPGNSNESVFELNWDSATYGQTSNSPSNYFTISATSTYRYASLMFSRMEEEATEASSPIRSKFGAYATLSNESTESTVGYIWKYRGTEYDDVTLLRPYADANYIIYRMADVLLMKAEALIWKSEEYWSDALEIINTVRIRSNLPDLDITVEETSEQELMQLLLNERDTELAAEGKRWYDLVRFGKAKSYKYKSDFIEIVVENNSSVNDSWIRSVLKNEYAWYLPISTSEIEVNQLLIQNPYYKSTN